MNVTKKFYLLLAIIVCLVTVPVFLMWKDAQRTALRYIDEAARELDDPGLIPLTLAPWTADAPAGLRFYCDRDDLVNVAAMEDAGFTEVQVTCVKTSGMPRLMLVGGTRPSRPAGGVRSR